MDNVKEIAEVYRKASLASITKKYDTKLSKDSHKPKDTLYLIHLLSLLLGLLNVLPITFFITANDYWMYKFRDTSKDTVDLKNKTTLQTFFSSGSLVVQTVPSIIFMVLCTTVAQKYKLKSRIVLSLFLILSIFMVFTAFIKINTDDWQLTFFIATLIGLVLITAGLNLVQVSSLALIPKFPDIYMKTFLIGQGAAGIFNAVLELISLALGTSSEDSALVYFITGTLVISATIGLYFFSQHLAFYRYYVQVDMEEKKNTYSKTVVKATAYQIWPTLAILFIWLLSVYMTHPSVTSLVVSENYGKGNKWNDVYFVPAVTFLFTDCSSMLGRYFGKPLLTQSNGPWIVALAIIRMLILVPLVMLCNAHPRNNLPVLLPHDWEYIILCFVYFFTSGFMLNVSILSIPKLAPENQELAYLIMLTVVGIQTGILCPLSLVSVLIL